jgi:hypothetical protein
MLDHWSGVVTVAASTPTKGFRAAALGRLLSYRFRENGDTRLLGDAEDCR